MITVEANLAVGEENPIPHGAPILTASDNTPMYKHQAIKYLINVLALRLFRVSI